MPAPETKIDGQELRVRTEGLELRAAGDESGAATTAGYAVLFDNITSIGGYWQERFAKGAFSKSLGERDVVAQVTDRGYSVKEVSGRLDISTKSLYD